MARLTSRLSKWRPCDTVETAVSWKKALQYADGPTALIFSRQNLPHQQRTDEQVALIERGGYVLAAEKGELKAIILATGSEVALAMQAHAQLEGVRVVSLPCCEVFMQQDAAYRESVLPSAIRQRVAVEASHVDYWYKFVGLDGKIIGMTTYGESAPAAELFKYFGITADAVVAAVQELLGQG
jgi:transketolase